MTTTDHSSYSESTPEPSASAGPSCAGSTGSRRFRSAVSGLWYESADAAGSIDAVELYGERIFRNETELRMDFIRRVAAWADQLHSANVKDETRR